VQLPTRNHKIPDIRLPVPCRARTSEIMQKSFHRRPDLSELHASYGIPYQTGSSTTAVYLLFRQKPCGHSVKSQSIFHRIQEVLPYKARGSSNSGKEIGRNMLYLWDSQDHKQEKNVVKRKMCMLFVIQTLCRTCILKRKKRATNLQLSSLSK